VLSDFFFIAFIVGCAGVESFKRGEQLAGERRWDEAIEFHQKALEENPSSKEYKESLEKAKQESAKIHLEKAKQLMTAEKQADITRLEQAAKEADLAYKLDPQNKTVAAFYEDVNRKKSELQSLVKTLYSQADADLKKDDWLAAIQKLHRINEVFPGYEDTGDKLAQAVQQASAAYYKRGIDLGKQEDWRGATKALKAVVDINAGYLDAAKRYEEARSKDNVVYYIKAGNAAAQAMEWQRAVMLFERALEYDPSNQEVAGQLEKMKDKAAKSLFDQAIKDVQRGKIYQGAKKLELAKTYLPSLQDNALFKEFVAGNLGVKLIDRAEQYSEKGKWGNALIAYQRLEALDPNYKGLFFKIQEAKDNIKKRIRKSIAILDFKSPSIHKDAGRIVANKLMTFLYKNASGDVRIIERENLESILKELQLGQTGLVDVDTMKALSKMGGIDTFVMGDVLRFTSEYKDFPSMNQVKVVIDEEEVRNPEYVEWLILHKNPSEEDLKTAPPKTVIRKNHQLISYKTGLRKNQRVYRGLLQVG